MAKPAASRRTKEKSAQAAAFGRAIYALRIEKKLSQEELSFQSEIDRSYLGQLERGEKEPCLAVIFRLSRALDVGLVEMFGLTERLYGEGPKQLGKNQRVR